jgi:YesN/AraC family two-component response regulator
MSKAGGTALRILVAIDETPAPLWGTLPTGPVFVRTGQEAYQLLSSSHFDVVFLDLELPGLSGMELLPRIAAEGLCQAVVLTSAEPSFPYAQLGLVYSCVGYLLRPLQKQEVTGTLERIHPASDLPIHKTADRLVARFRTEPLGDRFETLGSAVIVSEANTPAVLGQWRALHQVTLDKLYENYPWLSLYHSIGDYAVSSQLREREGLLSLCRDKLQSLQDTLLELLPMTEDSQMDEILTFLLSHIDQDLPQKEVAKEFYMVSSTLSTRFGRHLGLSYREYTTKLKMLRAQYLLHHTSLSEVAIATMLGYKDRDYFNQLFYQRTGQTPQQTRLLSWSDYSI